MPFGTGEIRFGPETGHLLLRTGRSGVGSTVGHDLTIEIGDWSVRANIPESDPAQASVNARVELGSMVVREGTGGVKPLSDKDRAEILRNAGRTLDVGGHPTAVFESARITLDPGSDDRGTISGTLTLHGVAAPLSVRVEAQPDGGYLATTTVTQTAYGIKPYTALLGALKVRDNVAVELRVRAPG